MQVTCPVPGRRIALRGRPRPPWECPARGPSFHDPRRTEASLSTGLQLSAAVIDCVITVHRALGPGFVESVYRNALLVEFRRRGIMATAEVIVLVRYHGHVVGRHRIDLLVEGELVVELKTTDGLSKAHYAQVRSYLRASGLATALLINLAGVRADVRRVELPGDWSAAARRQPAADGEQQGGVA